MKTIAILEAECLFCKRGSIFPQQTGGTSGLFVCPYCNIVRPYSVGFNADYLSYEEAKETYGEETVKDVLWERGLE